MVAERQDKAEELLLTIGGDKRGFIGWWWCVPVALAYLEERLAGANTASSKNGCLSRIEDGNFRLEIKWNKI
jgi:hypothetical protein